MGQFKWVKFKLDYCNCIGIGCYMVIRFNIRNINYRRFVSSEFGTEL